MLYTLFSCSIKNRSNNHHITLKHHNLNSINIISLCKVISWNYLRHVDLTDPETVCRATLQVTGNTLNPFVTHLERYLACFSLFAVAGLAVLVAGAQGTDLGWDVMLVDAGRCCFSFLFFFLGVAFIIIVFPFDFDSVHCFVLQFKILVYRIISILLWCDVFYV